RVFVGGEALPMTVRERFFELLEASGLSAELWNQYGPTEATIDATYVRCGSSDRGRPVAIGRPVGNLRSHVVSGSLQAQPIGVRGELALSGVGLARGYEQRPAWTAERFVPDALGAERGSRLYLTGDGARFRADGEIELLGRLDRQVQLRGVRVELGELEAALAAHPSVGDLTVQVYEPQRGDQRVVAYVVAAAEASSGWSETLRVDLQRSLPSYMVPSTFVELEALPVAASGKLDRSALPAPEPGLQGSAREYRAPETPTEGIVAGIWSEVLGVDRVGLDDHFFDLGGHSLLATQVVSRLRNAFEVEVPLRKLFEAPTVAQLVLVVEGLQRLGRGLTRPALEPVARDGALPLSFAQQRLWFLDQLEPGSVAYNVPLALRLEGGLDWSVSARAVSEIVRRHEVLRTTFGELGGEPIQQISPARAVPLPLVDLSHLEPGEREAEAERLMASEAGSAFDLEYGPVLRAGLVRLGDSDHVVWLTIHHIATDGWSMGLLTRELAQLYAAFASHRPSPLPELAVQYADYAAWQRSWLSGEVLEAEVGYWRQQLAGAPPVMALPTDRPRSLARSQRSDRCAFELAPETSRSLVELARQSGSTLFMVLLAGFQSLLGRLSGESDVNVGSPIAGRTLLETEPLIGFFVNTLVLRGDLEGDPTFSGLVLRVRRMVLEAHTHQEVPFEKLVEELEPERSLDHTPLFQVMFVLQNVPSRDGEVEGLRLQPLTSMDEGSAKFDVNLGLVE
ncbi:MAG: condensation domain-containing protein, partial [Acidobacteriota bacterium]